MDPVPKLELSAVRDGGVDSRKLLRKVLRAQPLRLAA